MASLILAAQALLPAQRSPAEDRPPRPNLLLVTLDTTRADHLGAYGWRWARTPNLDALAGRGVLFERCDTAVPITLPSHASLLTGLYPPRHGVRDNGSFRLPP
ncbi:MAG: sulfatase-like hydrolase/transferase, partial [Acidobacteria bacterium]|nr:sulfatase-like hydrolase/transferase [Acidobacteriota bacterium]